MQIDKKVHKRERLLKVLIKTGITTLICILLLLGCTSNNNSPNLVPQSSGTSPNYWCTWYWQNYLIKKGEKVDNPDSKNVYTNSAARNELTQESVFGKDGMAVVILPKTRSDYYFLIDHGWQNKRIKNNTFFTGIMDTLDFPKYAHLEPKDRIKQMNNDIKALGWKGLGLWYRGNPTKEYMHQLVEWSKYAGIEYWKIDGGDIGHYYATQIRDEIYPELVLEHITGTGPLNSKWDVQGLDYYPSVYSVTEQVQQTLQSNAGTTLNKTSKKAIKSFDVIKNTDVFRTYDAAPLLVSTVTLGRVHDILAYTAGKSEYTALLNIQDDCNIAAALGLTVGVKRHPMNTPRMYNGKDFHAQIAGDRRVDKRLNEMDRLAIWQRIAPPMKAGYGDYNYSSNNLIDSIEFQKEHTWYVASHGKMVRQSAPAVMARNIALPEVRSNDLAPYVMASKFPNGAVAITTEGRVTPENSWIEPKADITLKEATVNYPIGIFGHYKSLTLNFGKRLPEDIVIYAQDLLSNKAINITNQVSIRSASVTIPGKLIDEIGTSENDSGDISVPGMVVKIINE